MDGGISVQFDRKVFLFCFFMFFFYFSKTPHFVDLDLFVKAIKILISKEVKCYFKGTIKTNKLQKDGVELQHVYVSKLLLPSTGLFIYGAKETE